MGVPALAQKEISSNPGPNSVTAPTDPKKKAADIDRKMAFYGVIEAFRQGHYPSNEQIDRTLDYTLNNSPIPVDELSPEGRQLIEHFRSIIGTSKKIVAEKNADELFQNFLHNTRDVDYAAHQQNIKDVALPTDKDAANKDGQAAAEHLRTLGKLIFTNAEARKLLKDIGLIGRDVAADAAAKVSDVARPSDEALATVDEPAPSNQWVGPDGQVRGHDEPVPDTGLAAKRDEAKAKKEAAKAEVQNSAGNVAGAVDDNTATDFNQVADNAQRTADQGVNNFQSNGVDGAQSTGIQTHGAVPNTQEQAQADAQAGANAAQDQAVAEKKKLQDKLASKIPQEHKDRAKEQLEKTKQYAKDKIPEERRQRFIYRLKKVVVENQRHRDYQDAIEFFFTLAETYGSHANTVAGDGTSKLGDVRNDTSFKTAETQLRTLLERFANGQSMSPIFEAVDQLYTDAKNDEQLSTWFKKLDKYLRECLQTPGYIMREQADRDGRALLDEGKSFWDPKTGKYAGHKDRFFDEVQRFFTSYADDPLNKELGEHVKAFTKDLLFDSEGKLTYKSGLWQDCRSVILPAFAEHIGYVPIPRIEYTDSQIDLVVENLTLDAQNLLPNIIEFEAKTYQKLSPYKNIKDASKHSFWISFSQIQTDLKDVAYYIKKKQGFPKIKDEGLADIFLGGKGISGKVHLESTGRKNHAYNIVDVKVKVDALDFKVRSARHQGLISLARPLVKGLVKKAVEKAIKDALTSALVQADAQISDILERSEAIKAQGEEGDATGAFESLKTAYAEKKSEAEEAKAKIDNAKPKGQFALVAKRESKILDWASKDSMVEKQGIKAEAAAKTEGNGWRSEAFSIV